MTVTTIETRGWLSDWTERVEALGVAGGWWTVVRGYDHWMEPILGWVPDGYVLSVEVEVLDRSEVDEVTGDAELAA